MSDPSLTINVEAMKRATLVTVAGRVDSSNAAELDNTLKEIMDDGTYNIILNLSDVSYMSSAGLRALVSALRECKKHRGDVRSERTIGTCRRGSRSRGFNSRRSATLPGL